MCGRCVILTFDEVLGVIQQIVVYAPIGLQPDWPARAPSVGTLAGAGTEAQSANAYPSSAAPLIIPAFDTALGVNRFEEGLLEARQLVWGFEEAWKPGQLVFNTRIESTDKPMWREALAHRRCVIPVTSFFETHQSETHPSAKTGRPVKRSYEFRVPGQSLMLIGGVWTGDRFSMVTTEANADMAPIHPRMPMVLRQEELPQWLGPNYQQLADRSSIPLEAEPADRGADAAGTLPLF